MARFEITAPDGGRYEVEGENEQGALAALQQHVGSSAKAPAGDESAAIGRGLISGMPVVGPYLLGGVNRAVAGVRSLQSGKPYADELNTVQGFSDATAKNNPKSTVAGEVAGGVLAMAPAVAAAPAAFGAGAAALPARMVASGASGMALGGADAAVRSGGDLKATGMGAVTGGALGLAGPAVIAGGSKLAAPVIGMFSPKIGAENRLSQAVVNSGKSRAQIGEGMENARTLGKGGEWTLADELGTAGGAAVGSAARGNGPARERIVQTLNNRQAAQPERLIGDVEDAFGTSGTAKGRSQQLLEEGRAGSGPKYGEAMKVDPEDQMRLREFANDPVVARGMKQGAEIERIEQLAKGRPPPQTILDEVPASTPPPVARPIKPEKQPRVARPQTLGEYIAQNGGIQTDDDLIHAGLDKFRIPWKGSVVKKNGLSLDGHWRTKLQDEGFLTRPGDGYTNSRDIREELMDALRREQGGQPTYRAQDMGALEAWQAKGMVASNAEALSDHTGRVRRELIEAGVPEHSIDPRALDEGARASMLDRDGLEAYERAIQKAGQSLSEAPASSPSRMTAAEYRASLNAPTAEEAQPLTMRQMQQAKIGLDAIVEGERDAIKGLSPYGRAVNQLRQSLVTELGRVNPAYAEANAIYRGPMEIRDAIDLGLKAARSGRPADNIASFLRIQAPVEQQGFRQGYADKLISRIEGSSGDGVDRSRMFTSPKVRQEVSTFALPGKGEEFWGRHGLEQTMAATRQRAIGGSPTAEKLADDASFNVPGAIASLLAGHPGQAALAVGRGSLNVATGNLPKVRSRLADILLSTAQEGGDKTLDTISQDVLRRRALAAIILAQSAQGAARQPDRR